MSGLRYRWIVFDADGTLFDFDRAQRAALAEAFLAFGGELTEELERSYREIGAELWAELEAGRMTSDRLRLARFERLFAAAGLDHDPASFSDAYLDRIGRRTDLVPGAETLVRRLAADVGLLLATNGFADVQRRRFAASPLTDHFHSVVISDEVGAAKPHAAFFDRAFAEMGEPPRDEVLVVGDSLSADIAGGEGYGVDTCWFNPAGDASTGEARPTHEIRHLDELPAIVGLDGRPDPAIP